MLALKIVRSITPCITRSIEKVPRDRIERGGDVRDFYESVF